MPALATASCVTDFVTENSHLSVADLRGNLLAVRKYQVQTDGKNVRMLVLKLSLLGAENCFDFGNPKIVLEHEGLQAKLRMLRLYVFIFALRPSDLCCSKEQSIQVSSRLTVHFAHHLACILAYVSCFYQ